MAEDDSSAYAQTWVLVDEDERSISDGYFETDPTGRLWYDFPAISAHRHNFTYTLAFADGHGETHRWLSAKTSIPVKFNYFNTTLDPSGRADYQWLLSRAAVAF